jgi:ornithine decarboxylase
LLPFLIKHKSIWEQETPCFVISLDALRNNIASLKEALQGEIAYSHKTNPHHGVIESVANNGCSFLLSSVEELANLMTFPNISKEKCIFQSPSLTHEQFRQIRQIGVRRFIVDSTHQMNLILEDVNSNNCLELLIRINTGIKVNKPELSYGMDSYLGFPLKEASKIFKKLNILRKKEKIKLGIHNHLISQNTYLDIWKKNLKTITEFALEMKSEGITIDAVDFGGGYPVEYLKPVPKLSEISALIVNAQKRISKAYPKMHYIFEPGRKLIAESVVLVAKVVHTKNFLDKNIAILDCSLYSHSLDTLIVNLCLPVAKIHSNNKKGKIKTYTVRGSTPDSRDVFCRNVILPPLKDGDHLTFLNCGAYTFSSDFISLSKAKYIAI